MIVMMNELQSRVRNSVMFAYIRSDMHDISLSGTVTGHARTSRPAA
jgi:hypothetical protein